MNRYKKVDELNAYFPEVSYLKNDQEMQDIMKKHIVADVYGHGTLPLPMREYITLAVLSANGGDEMMKDHVRALHMHGVDAQVIKEVMYHVIPYAGLLNVNKALKYVNEVFDELGLHNACLGSNVTEDMRFSKGFEAQCSVFAREVIQDNHEHAPDDVKHIQTSLSAHCFGDFYTRTGLCMQERELLTFCVIASLGGCENQLRAHVHANLTAGATRNTLIEAITQCQPYIGYPRTLNAIQILHEETKKEKIMEHRKDNHKEDIFPLGEENIEYAPYFVGKSYLKMLVSDPMGIANVTFEPACRNNWHIHHKGGQILLVTRGKGWYQEWGKEPQLLKAGDVVNIPAEVKHWHGATRDCWFSHIAIAVTKEGSSNEWLEEICEVEYRRLPSI